jgi:aminomuconate-semialdehyde/2-hydroxymuconate-6-semialdehyde dehydrogenase
MLVKNYINGIFIDGKSNFANINPATGEIISRVVEADKADVDNAVIAAKKALEGPWGSMLLSERAECLNRIADGIEEKFDDFVAAEIADTGKPLSQATSIDIPRGVANFRFFADLIKSVATESFETHTHDGRHALNYAVKRPLGVVGVISPWNLPFLLMTWKLAPALAAGNTVIVKPSEETPSTALLLAEVMNQQGLPKGVFNLVNGFGQNSAGEFLASHPGVDAITFTGESSTGTAIMKASSPSLKELSFELGGKNAAIIFEDADFEKAVAGTAKSTFTNCGQVCLCTERVYVQRPIFDKFVEALKEKAESIKIGLPYDEGTQMGPLVSHAHREKVLSYFNLAEEEGATVITGGKIPDFDDKKSDGAFIEPTIWTGLPESARCIKEEIFGPVCHITPFDTEEEAVAMANNSRYGLAAAVWTENLTRAHRVAGQMEVGVAWVNTWYLRDLRTPFGGSKMSGIGREGGLHSLDFYSQPTNVCIELSS